MQDAGGILGNVGLWKPVAAAEDDVAEGVDIEGAMFEEAPWDLSRPSTACCCGGSGHDEDSEETCCKDNTGPDSQRSPEADGVQHAVHEEWARGANDVLAGKLHPVRRRSVSGSEVLV